MAAFSILLGTLAGCGGGPSDREVKNARAFEALLTAVSLKNTKELERDARLIDERHASGEISDARHKDLRAIIDKARAGDWGAAESRAYEFRAPFGDRGSYFK
ncbi:MAG: hypothetical protein LC745_05145 [Planctomycetia bacterium]|nr:hypothetical protein [Planctomycetia bacterium]